MKSLYFSMLLVFASMASAAMPRLSTSLPGDYVRSAHPTNCEVICGVKMPPKYSQRLWQKRRELREKFFADFKRLESIADDEYHAALTDEQREALRKLSAMQERQYGEMMARQKARQDELVAITNRAAYIKKEWHEKRRSEYEFHEGLYWLDEPVFKETVSRTENGKIVVHILYTRGKNGKEKRHRYDPAAIVRQLEGVKNKEGAGK